MLKQVQHDGPGKSYTPENEEAALITASDEVEEREPGDVARRLLLGAFRSTFAFALADGCRRHRGSTALGIRLLGSLGRGRVGARPRSGRHGAKLPMD